MCNSVNYGAVIVLLLTWALYMMATHKPSPINAAKAAVLKIYAKTETVCGWVNSKMALAVT
jgi:hypothetical protein